MYLDYLGEGLGRGFSHQGQQQATMELSDAGSNSNREGSEGPPVVTSVFGNGKELLGVFQDC